MFKPDISLNELCFEGTVEWAIESMQLGLVFGIKFQYINQATGTPFAVSEIL